MSKPEYTKTWNFKVASMFFGITIVIAVMYWAGMLREMFHVQPDYSTILIICTITGIIAGVIYAVKEKWWLGIVPGALGGAGAFAIFNWYMTIFERTVIIRIEAILVCLVGALPGIILYFVLRRLYIKNK